MNELTGSNHPAPEPINPVSEPIDPIPEPIIGSIVGPVSGRPKPKAGLYLHWPFCDTKCGYCDFYSVPKGGRSVEPVLEAILVELASRVPAAGLEIATVFIGGGTPTTLENNLLRHLLERVRHATRSFTVEEFTIEANPATVDVSKTRILAELGVNRVSLGAQSFHSNELDALERIHHPADIPVAVATIREVGIENFNLDLIFGISGQTLASWRSSLRRALDLEPAHVSCYGLTYEPGTVLTRQLEAGRIVPCDDGLEAEMYEVAIEDLARAGFEHYEISGFARPGRRCMHNLIYWRNESYVGIGPSAAGCYGGRRYRNVPNYEAYVRRIQAGGEAVGEDEELGPCERAIEMLLMQLRLREGFRFDDFERHTGFDLRTIAAATLTALESNKLIDVENGRLRVSRRGLLFADGVIAELASALDSHTGGNKSCSLPVVKTK